MRRLVAALILLLAACQISVAQTYSDTTLYNFPTNIYGDFSGPFSLLPSSLIQASDGNLYGTTIAGGSNYMGSIFRVAPDGVVTTVYTAPGQSGMVSPAQLVVAGDGNLYGITASPANLYQFYNNTQPGSVFRMTPSGEVTILYTFCSQGGFNCTDGAIPVSLILGSDGNLYGTTMGLNPAFLPGAGGTIFRITLSGTLTTLYALCVPRSGFEPVCAQAQYANTIVQASDGNFYGAAYSANFLPGLIYEFTASGEFKTLHSFCSQGGSACTDGEEGNGLIQASPDALYGTAAMGGANGDGVAFKISQAGGYQKLYDFCSDGGTSCTDGGTPVGFFQASDGNLADVTSYGGYLNSGGGSSGTVGYLTLSGAQKTALDFCLTNCNDGAVPSTPPMQAADGNFYGTTQQGGVNGTGTIYRLAVSPALPPPIQVTVTPATVAKGDPAMLQWSVPNAYSLTQQQCYAFIDPSIPGDASYGGNWTGKQAGTLAKGVLSGSATVTPTGAGTFTYALTCGGTISGFATLTVPGATSATSFSLTPTTVPIGQPITGSVSVTGTGSGVRPTGNVTFYSGNDALGTVRLNSSGTATITASTAPYAPGAYTVIAKYSGDTVYDPSTSSPVTVTVDPIYATSTALTESATTVTPPQTCTFTATVTRNSGSGAPTGAVEFFNSNTPLGSRPLNSSGVATFTASSQGVPAGQYSIIAQYSGDDGDTGSTSNEVGITVK